MSDWHFDVLMRYYGYGYRIQAIRVYESLYRDREHPSSHAELEHIHDLFAKARLRGKS